MPENIVVGNVYKMHTETGGYVLDSDINTAIFRIFTSNKTVPYEEFEISPYSVAWKVMLVPCEEEEVILPNLLEAGEYVEPPRAYRDTPIEYPVLAQPLLTGKRIQIHKEETTITVFDHKGNILSGIITINGENGETIEKDLSKLFMGLMDTSCFVGIFDAVLIPEEDKIFITDILRKDNIAYDTASTKIRDEALVRMDFGEGIEHLGCQIMRAEEDKCIWSNAIYRPVYSDYWSYDWAIVGE